MRALAQVLSSERDKADTAIIGRTHEGLVRLTGKRLPPDPQQWNEVVQAGVVLAPAADVVGRRGRECGSVGEVVFGEPGA